MAALTSARPRSTRASAAARTGDLPGGGRNQQAWPSKPPGPGASAGAGDPAGEVSQPG